MTDIAVAKELAEYEPDRSLEAKRLAPYGLEPDQVLNHSLIIPAGARMRLDAPNAKAGHPAVFRREPKSIDDVKRWIGVHDELGAKRACGCSLPSALPAAKSASDLRRADPAVLQSLYGVADEYVNGDSRRVAAYQPILNQLVDRSWINFFMIRHDIDILNGSVLTVGSNIKVLWAANIRIWKGGLLKFVGNAKVDCLSIVGNYSGTHRIIDNTVFNGVLTLEA